MRHFILSFSFIPALLLWAAGARAQLTVDSFEKLQNDLTATLSGTRKLDHNGETAALIKIQTTGRDFSFDTGVLGIVATVYHPGEVWLYVPNHVQKVSIHHAVFGNLTDWFFPETIETGTTYRMLLNVGGGRFTNITCSGAPSAKVYIDGEYAGETPLRNYFLTDGQRHLHALTGRMECDTVVSVSPGEGIMPLNLQLHDMSYLYGDVEVTVEGQADIWFQGRNEGVGRWQTQLREGTYEVTTRKVDCDSVVTRFTVKRGQMNHIQAEAPRPHTGRLRIFTRPRGVMTTLRGQNVDLTVPQVMNIGSYHLAFSRKGYHPQEREYTVRRNELTEDTVSLEAISWLKNTTFYFGAAYTLRGLSGFTATLGGILNGHDLQLAYTLGTASSKAGYWYDGQGLLQSGLTYKLNSWSVRYGYQVRLLPRLGFTPQVGFMQQQLTGSLTEGTEKYGDGAKASCLTLGVKLLAVPVQHGYVFLQPEYAMVLSKDEVFDTVAKGADFSIGGFGVTAGVIISL